MYNNFPNDFFRKIFVKIFVVFKGLKPKKFQVIGVILLLSVYVCDYNMSHNII